MLPIAPIKLRLAPTHQDAFQAFQISEQVGTGLFAEVHARVTSSSD